MTNYAAVTKIITEFLKTSTVADTEIDTELNMKSARKKGLELLGDLIVFKLMNDVSPDFINNLELEINNKVNDLEDAARRCRKLRARERRIWEESQEAKRVTVA